MKIYLVGGAVRDTLLGLPIKDKDWVVVGSTPEDMLNLGYQKVGRDFPVFLHPHTHEEYALARTEKKVGSGYTGFICYSHPNVTLEQDLQRRDLTINALAKDDNNNIIDPFNGISDLKNCLIRHVSPAFSEDPLRVLRVARFAAQYAHMGFRIADQTMNLLKVISNNGELKFLTAERIWKETEKALLTCSPHIYFQVLRDCKALKYLLPEVDALFGIPASKKWYPEVDTGIHTLMTLRISATLSSDLDVRFAALCHDLGKALTPKQFWPFHHGHGLAGLKPIENLCRNLHVPNELRDLAKLAAKFHEKIYGFLKLKPEEIVKIFDNIDAWRKPHRVEKIALVNKANMLSYSGYEDIFHSQSNLLCKAWKEVHSVSAKSIVKSGYYGIKVREELIKRRIQAIIYWKKYL